MALIIEASITIGSNVTIAAEAIISVVAVNGSALSANYRAGGSDIVAVKYGY